MTSVSRVEFGRVEWFAGAVPSGRDVKTLGEGGVAEQGGVQRWQSRAAPCILKAKSCTKRVVRVRMCLVVSDVSGREEASARIGQHKMRNNNTTTAAIQLKRGVDDDTTRPGWQQGTLVRVALGPAGASELDVMLAQRSDRK
jgi:hypothetical protein